MAGDSNLGVTVTRTLIPNLPPSYLSRRHLFPLIENQSGGTTFVIAPPGYGKTTLISEWAQNQSKGVIWLTVANGDTTHEMSAMLIAATRRVIPDFAPWFERDQPIRPTEVVRRWGNDLLATGAEYVFVLDNLRSPENEDVDIAVKLIEQFPGNIHFVAIRSYELAAIYGICASRGPIKALSVQDLRFTDSEIEQLAHNSGLEVTNDVMEMLRAGAGWAAATSLLIAHLQAKGERIDIELLIRSHVEPLRALVMLALNGLDPDVLEICEKLAILAEFTLEEAALLLGESYDFNLINTVSYKGEIFAPVRAPGSGYSFSPMVRQVLLERLSNRAELKERLHTIMIDHYVKIGQLSLAIDHAFAIGDQEHISTLFPGAARIKQAQGKGGELIRWSAFAGMSPVDGVLKRSTVMITGLLADLDFTAANSEINKLELLAPQSDNFPFFSQFAAAARTYSMLSLGEFERLESTIRGLSLGSTECKLGIDDQINLLRLLATKRYIWNDAEGVENIYLEARELAKQTTLFTSHVFLLSIESMYLHQLGQYRRAFDVANGALIQFKQNNFVGNHGPLDVMYVIGRCLLEFSRPQQAFAIFEEIQSRAEEWKQWHWYLASEQHFMEFLTYRGQLQEALERLSKARQKVGLIDSENQLATFCDLAEMNVRRNLKDFDRLETLLSRTPDIRHTKQMKLALDEFRGRKSFTDDALKFPSKAPRDAIWKHLMDVSLNIKAEKIALTSMLKALEIGAEVGAKETFLRQNDEMGNLIIKIANLYPTVYHEELAAAMADRIKERNSQISFARPALTKRELEILRQLSTARTLTVISQELHISQNTMKTHLKNLYRKLGVSGRIEAVDKARSSFLI